MAIVEESNTLKSPTFAISKEEDGDGGTREKLGTRASEVCCCAIIKRKSCFRTRADDIDGPVPAVKISAHVIFQAQYPHDIVAGQ